MQGVGGEDITDAHIDGFARFYDQNTIVTVPRDDFADLYEKIKMSDYKQLTTATNAAGQRYQIKELPLTAKNVKGLDYRGSYVNYYVGNQVVLLQYMGIKMTKLLKSGWQHGIQTRKWCQSMSLSFIKMGG